MVEEMEATKGESLVKGASDSSSGEKRVPQPFRVRGSESRSRVVGRRS